MEYLRTVSESLADASMRSRCEVIISSSVVYAIVKFAELEKADLIMMYTHDRKGLAKLIKGSIAEKVSRKATIEVQIIRPRELVAI